MTTIIVPTPQEILSPIAQAIFDKKGFNILGLDARDCATLADYFVIAEGSSDRHLRAVCDALIDSMAARGMIPLALEGKKFGEWIAVDYGDVIVHLFGPSWREVYALEELWRESKIVDLALKTTTSLPDE